MILVIPFKVVCVLTGNLLVRHFSKFEIQGELDLAGTRSGNRLPKSGNWRQAWAIHGIDLGDVRTVEHIEEFRDQVETFHPAKREILQDAKVHRSQCRCVQRISAESERSC